MCFGEGEEYPSQMTGLSVRVCVYVYVCACACLCCVSVCVAAGGMGVVLPGELHTLRIYFPNSRRSKIQFPTLATSGAHQ